ncbi:hypothetical protein FDA28_04420 [Clostridium botulinum]|nr:hypothetical protein [Clostridium botulinum]
MVIKSMNSAHSEINVILNEFQRIGQEVGNIEIPITYFLTSTNLLKEEIYEVIHLLIECGIVIKSEYVECPYCLNEEKIIHDNIQKRCNRCKEYFDQETIIEKFMLHPMYKNEKIKIEG